MAENAFTLAKKWDSADEESFGKLTYSRLYETVEFLSERHYFQYTPTLGSEYPEFLTRFDQWIDNVDSDEDKRILFEFAPQVLFFGRDEFTQLQRSAFRGPITRWVIEQLALTPEDAQFAARVAEELKRHTWYCPVTDSMSISDFHHANGIGGVDFRPDFRSLARFGDPQKVRDFMRPQPDRPNELKRIVLLEDFVGTGSQIPKAVKFAASLDANIQVLFVALLICPDGAKSMRQMTAALPNASYDAVLELDEELFIAAGSVHAPGTLSAAVRNLCQRTYDKVKGDEACAPRPYSPYGYPGTDGTGATVVTYSNTPDNTLPILHHESNTWKPLFRRSARIK